MIYTDSRGERWHLYNEPPPIPIRSHDWNATHEGYDGAPDSGDARSFYAGSYHDVVECVEEYVEGQDG